MSLRDEILEQPEVAARSMLGKPATWDRLPYFFSDQYDLGMEYSGYAEPGSYDQVVFRGDVPAREFVAFWLADGRVLAGMNVNVWDAAARRPARTWWPSRARTPATGRSRPAGEPRHLARRPVTSRHLGRPCAPTCARSPTSWRNSGPVWRSWPGYDTSSAPRQPRGLDGPERVDAGHPAPRGWAAVVRLLGTAIPTCSTP